MTSRRFLRRLTLFDWLMIVTGFIALLAFGGMELALGEEVPTTAWIIWVEGPGTGGERISLVYETPDECAALHNRAVNDPVISAYSDCIKLEMKVEMHKKVSQGEKT